MISPNDEIITIKNLVESFYIRGEHKSDRHVVEKEIKKFLKRQSKISEKIADDIWDRCHYIMKHGHHRFSEAWIMIENILINHCDGLYDQIKESANKFYKTDSDKDRKEVQQRVRDYLKHVIKLDEKTGDDHLRHELVDDVLKDLLVYAKFDTSEFEELWVQIQDIIDWAWKIDSRYVSDDFSKMSNRELTETFVPDVYQKDVFKIDYQKLKMSGIKVITFDINETILPKGHKKPSEEIKNQFLKLREMGFQLALFSNGNPNKVKRVAEELSVFYSMGEGNKPHIFGFDRIIRQYIAQGLGKELSYERMAHVGNDITKDVQAGNKVGVTTCLVRTFGGCGGHTGADFPEMHKVTKLLEKRGIWRKHHKSIKDDQYYQLGEKQN